MEVCKKQGGPLTIDRSFVSSQRSQIVERGDHRDDDDQARGGDDASGATTVEVQDRRASSRFTFSEKETGDHKPRDDEEDVYADVASGDPRNARVKEDDQKDRNGAEPLNIGTKSTVTRCCSRLVAGGRCNDRLRPTSR